jgi:tetratricopeptide (TPR) repeat protein
MKTFSAIILFSIVTISYQCFSQSDSLKRRELLNAYTDSVVHACTAAIKLNPKDEYAYYKRGKANFDVQDYEKALADFSKAIELDTNYMNAYYYRAEIYLYYLHADWNKMDEIKNNPNLR